MFVDKYPYTNFHNVNLDWVLQKVKEWGELVEENDRKFHDLEEANADFKEYVTTYLQELDVQDEIDNKLDRLLATGVLESYMAPYVASSAGDWLSAHITPTTPPLDTSLSVRNAAAESKAVGDAIKLYGWSESAKSALLGLFALVAYQSNSALTMYNNLKYFLTHPESSLSVIYTIPDEIEFTGDPSERINTGVYPLETDTDFTITITFKRSTTTPSGTATVAQCVEGSSPYWGLQILRIFGASATVYDFVCFGQTYSNTWITKGEPNDVKVVIRHSTGDGNCSVKWKVGGEVITLSIGYSVKTINSQLLLGVGGVIGTLKEFTWYLGRMSDAEVNDYLS